MSGRNPLVDELPYGSAGLCCVGHPCGVLKFVRTRQSLSFSFAVVGYCMGAVLAIRAAAAHPDQVAVVGFHPGNLVTEAPDSPHQLAPELAAHVHLGHAEGDMSAEAVAELDRPSRPPVSTTPAKSTPAPFTDSPCPIPMPSLQRHWDRLLALLARALNNNSVRGPGQS